MTSKTQIEKWQETYPQMYKLLHEQSKCSLAQYLRLPLVEIEKLIAMWEARNPGSNELPMLRLAQAWRQDQK